VLDQIGESGVVIAPHCDADFGVALIRQHNSMDFLKVAGCAESDLTDLLLLEYEPHKVHNRPILHVLGIGNFVSAELDLEFLDRLGVLLDGGPLGSAQAVSVVGGIELVSLLDPHSLHQICLPDIDEIVVFPHIVIEESGGDIPGIVGKNAVEELPRASGVGPLLDRGLGLHADADGPIAVVAVQKTDLVIFLRQNCGTARLGISALVDIAELGFGVLALGLGQRDPGVALWVGVVGALELVHDYGLADHALNLGVDHFRLLDDDHRFLVEEEV